jgi:hypothetical protein
VLEAGSQGGGQFRNPEEAQHLPLEAVPSNGSEDMTVDTSVCVIVNCSHTLYQNVTHVKTMHVRSTVSHGRLM